MSAPIGQSPKRSGNFTAAVGAGLNIQGVAAVAGKRIRLRSVVMSASVSGRYTLVDNSAGNPVLYDGHLLANEPLILNIPGEGFSTVSQNVAVSFVNNTIGAADMALTCFYDEIL